MNTLERIFRIREAGSTPSREVMGGVTTFVTMAYIVFVNPAILANAGMPLEGVFVATCLSAALGSILMALLANYPIALAPGMGLNAYFAFTIAGAMGVPWQTALGLVFWAAVIFVIMTVTGARKAIVAAVPVTIRLAGAAGIGLFIAFIGLKQAGLVIDSPATLVQLATPRHPAVVLAIAGLGLTLFMAAKGIRTSIFWGLLFTLVTGIAFGIVPAPDAIFGVPSFDLPGFQIDFMGALHPEYLPIIFVILFFDIFDTLGTLLGVAHEGGMLKDGELPRIDRALSADATASLAGALFGTSTVTSYIESGAGVGVGARTGLHSVVVGVLFLLALFIKPLAAVVGGGVEVEGIGMLAPVTAPALIVVGTMMLPAVREIDWTDVTESLPAFFTILLMPLTYNISHGLAVGIMVYVLAKAAAGRFKEIHWIMWVLAGLFLLRYALLPA